MFKIFFTILFVFLSFFATSANANIAFADVAKTVIDLSKKGKKLTPTERWKNIGKKVIDEGWDALNDPENTDPHRGKDKDDDDDNDGCDGTWMYHSVQGGPGTQSGSYVEHAQTVFYDYVVNQTRKNMGSNPFVEPNFRDGGKGYDRSDGNEERFVEYDTYDWWGRKTSGRLQVYKYCDDSKPKKDKDDDNDKDKDKKDDSSDDDSSDDDDGKDGKDGKDGDDGDKGKKGDDGDDGKDGKDGKDGDDDDGKDGKDGKDGDDGDKGKKGDDGDDGKDGKDGKDGDDDDGSKSEKPHCNYSEFHKKVCDWIDWTQKDDLDEKDGKVEVKDLGKDLELDDDKVQFGQSCPSGQTFTFTVAGATVSETISYNDLCTGFIKLRPFVIAIGYIISAMIIGGRRV